MKLTRYFFICVIFIGNFGFTQTLLDQKRDAFTSFSGFSNGSISLMAMDVATGATVVEYNSQTALPTASTMKLFSTASAIELLGTNYKAKTSIYYEGIISADSILNGNIWIIGGGDMTLGSMYFNEEGKQSQFLAQWSKAIQQAGIKTISGSIIADASKFGYEGAPDGWNWSDMGNYYGAGFSGLTIYDNMLKYHFKTGAAGKTTLLTHTFPTVENFTFHNYIVSANVKGDNSYIYGAPYSLDRFGTGKLPVNTGDFMVKGSLPDPEYQVAYELYQSLIEQGILVKGSAMAKRHHDDLATSNNLQLINSFEGKSVLDIATITNHKSINLFAEGLLCSVGFIKTGNGSSDASCNYIESYWSSKLAVNGLHINDGSGLSRTNAVSASHFCLLLKSMYESKNYAAFLSTLPIAGESGTLKNVCRNQAAHGRLKAKSGTMNRIKSYAGYIETKSGKTLAVAIIVNNYTCSTSTVVDEMEKVFNALVEY